MRIVLLMVAAVCWLCPAASAESIGVLVLAHGGSEEWNRTVHQTVEAAKLDAPTAVVFGMGMHPGEVATLREAASHLQDHGIERLIVVPLLISSHSEVYRQFEYLFGLREQAAWPEAGTPVALRVPVVMAPALDDDAVLAEILLDRAKALSKQPEQETVILVAHGPNEDRDNQRWLENMQQASEAIKQQLGFRDVVTRTMRDDAEAPVLAQATAELRKTVQAADEQGDALVVPVLMARGGIEYEVENS